MAHEPRRISVVLFEGFELLDVFGPVDLFNRLPDAVTVELIGPALGPVRSSQGSAVLVERTYTGAPDPDIVMVPGGNGARALVSDDAFLTWLATWAKPARLVSSVCTGSALLAAAGLLDGYRATSNKRRFTWVSDLGADVTWVPRARWVHDRDRWTSSGIAAGMDMAAALIAHLYGRPEAERAAREIELEIHPDPDWDPFAGAYGLA